MSLGAARQISIGFFVTCNFVGYKSRMNWDQIMSLYHQGNDIGSKTMTYKILIKLSSPELNYEVGQSKKCLQDHGVNNVSLFATPRGLAWNNATVINTTITLQLMVMV